MILPLYAYLPMFHYPTGPVPKREHAIPRHDGHDQERVDAAEAKRARRRQRNLDAS